MYDDIIRRYRWNLHRHQDDLSWYHVYMVWFFSREILSSVSIILFFLLFISLLIQHWRWSFSFFYEECTVNTNEDVIWSPLKYLFISQPTVTYMGIIIIQKKTVAEKSQGHIDKWNVIADSFFLRMWEWRCMLKEGDHWFFFREWFSVALSLSIWRHPCSNDDYCFLGREEKEEARLSRER